MTKLVPFRTKKYLGLLSVPYHNGDKVVQSTSSRVLSM